MYSILYFDVEDSISPPEAGCDDIVMWVAKELDKVGLTGCFHIIGDKARCLFQRGRFDIIKSLEHHDVSSHYNHGSVHPNTAELVAKLDWDNGVVVAEELEKVGFADLEEIFGKCSALTRHGGMFAPQIVHACSKQGKPFYGMPMELERYRSFWYCGALVFSLPGLIINPELNHPAYMESIYGDTKAFDEKLSKLEPILDECIESYEFTSLFGFHPHKMLCEKFACFNHYDGVSRVDMQAPPLKDLSVVDLEKKNFIRYIEFLSKVKGLDIIKLGDLQSIFGKTVQKIKLASLSDYAYKICSEKKIALHDYFSPAELLHAMALAISEFNHKSVWPMYIEPKQNILGPKYKWGRTSGKTCRDEQLFDLNEKLIEHIDIHQALPPFLNVSGESFTLPEVTMLIAHALLELQKVDHPIIMSADDGLVPEFSKNWKTPIEELKEWGVFSPNHDMSRIVELSLLQSWSAKPAHPHLKLESI